MGNRSEKTNRSDKVMVVGMLKNRSSALLAPDGPFGGNVGLAAGAKPSFFSRKRGIVLTSWGE